MSNRVSERRKMCRDQVPEICIRVILSVCLTIKMHKHKGGPHKARQNNYWEKNNSLGKNYWESETWATLSQMEASEL